ncbi:AMP-binding protein [Pontibacter sp. HSC-36F09]|uniref:AMP-binding protein n=1 Tax=Pontibacter sp. HSC-36F09 TaxID=2910966 RepID=UPI00209DEC16|nr:AMP-binding protein [Pontibacter sp. HSC-36F09]MCP2044077.1 fatty-acyl-CoA synthase [Pontibacter sp. HSC-36F09]
MNSTPSYSHGVSTTPLRGETIGQSLRNTVEKFGDREALVMVTQNYRATYRELWEQVTQVAKSLVAYGIQRGDRVGIWAPNRVEWVLVQFATARVGAVLVNINPAYKTNDLKYALKQSQISLLIASHYFRQTDYVEMLNHIRPDCEYPTRTVIMERDWERFIAAGQAVTDQELAEREATLQFDDPINIQYTSGTTGLPKGATLSHHNILNNGFFIGETLKYTEHDRVCIPVPFYHCFGMVIGNMACITHGSCMIIPAETFDPEQVMQTVQAEKCTSLYGVPTMFIAELEHPNFSQYDFSTLRTGVMAGSNCPIETMKQVQSRMNMREVTVCYGMTETSPVSTQSQLDDPLEKRVSTVGKVHPHLEVKIVDPETGLIVPRGQKGEFCTRGYSVMLGYWDMSEATARVLQNGWMHTGDLAVMDEEGYVQMVGRIKDLIIRGGENIAPREIEEFLLTHEAISDVHIIGVPDHKYGEEVMAWVKLRQGFYATSEDITGYCKGQIATFKIPKYWKFVEDFPMTVTGKIRKMEMRDISTRELGLVEEA